jgi:glycine/D-amino acid oxidase-like deaminating enzyme
VSERVAVVGAGVAGVAAAITATDGGAEVEVVSAGSGASALTSGALDWTTWVRPSEAPALSAALEARLSSLVAELDLELGERELVTGAGLIRRAAGSDRWVLSLAKLPPDAPVGVLVSNWAFDQGRQLLSTLRTDPRAAGRTFVAVSGDRLFSDDEQALPLAALLEAFSAPVAGRLALLAEQAQAIGAAALLVGPYLGGHPAALGELSRAPIPVREVLSPPDGSAGRRLETRLHEALSRRAIAHTRARVKTLRASARSVVLVLETERSSTIERELEVDRVVLATGGLIGGGLALGAGPGQAIGSPLLDGTADSGSRFGWDGAADGGSWLRPGLGPGAPREHCGGRVLAVGDVRAGAEQTILSALRDGLSLGVA